jgi:Na+/melibiose symporter-like transporter
MIAAWAMHSLATAGAERVKAGSPPSRDLRKQRWIIRLCCYVFAFGVFFLGIALPRGWWPVIVIWVVGWFAGFAWYLFTVRRNTREKRVEGTAETEAAARRRLGTQLRWPPVLTLVGAALLFTAGFTGVRDPALVFAVSGLMFLMGIMLVVWAARLRKA